MRCGASWLKEHLTDDDDGDVAEVLGGAGSGQATANHSGVTRRGSTSAISLALFLISFGYLALAPTSAASSSQSRTETYVYDAPSAGTVHVFAACFSDYQDPPRIGCAPLEKFGKERWVTVNIKDSSGMPVAYRISQFSETTGVEQVEHFCSSSPERAKLIKGLTNGLVSVVNGPCPDGTPAVATSGEIKLTYGR